MNMASSPGYVAAGAHRQLAAAIADAWVAPTEGYLAIRPEASPAETRDMYLAYCHLQDTCDRLAAEMFEARELLHDRFILARMKQDLEAATVKAWRRLKAMARSGGRGTPIERCAS